MAVWHNVWHAENDGLYPGRAEARFGAHRDRERIERGGGHPGGVARRHYRRQRAAAAASPVPEREAAPCRAFRYAARRLRRGVILLDTSGLLSALDSSQRQHAECVGVLQRAAAPLF